MRLNAGMTLMLAGVLGVGMAVAQSPQGGGGQGTQPATAGSAQGSAQATPENMNQDPTTMGLAPSDATFVKKAIMGNNAEIDAAKMALEKSQNQAVKDFAQKMVDDHTKMLSDLKAVAEKDNIKFEDKASPMGQKLAAKLQGLNGTAFDKAYVDGMVKDHKEDVRAFSTEINHGKKQDVKDVATQALPIIKEHLQIVEGLKKQVG